MASFNLHGTGTLGLSALTKEPVTALPPLPFAWLEEVPPKVKAEIEAFRRLAQKVSQDYLDKKPLGRYRRALKQLSWRFDHLPTTRPRMSLTAAKELHETVRMLYTYIEQYVDNRYWPPRPVNDQSVNEFARYGWPVNPQRK